MTRKRVSRARKRDLEKPDEFLSLSATLIQALRRYRTHVAIGAALVFASLAVYSGVRFFSSKAENRAFQLLRDNLQTYQEAARDNAPDQALAKVVPQFESLLADYGRRDGGKLARLVFADLNYRAGNYDTAITHLKKVLEILPPDHFAYGSALSGLGYAYLETDNRDQALVRFEQIVAGHHPQFRNDALYQLGRLYGEQGQTAKQKELFQRLLDEAPTYMYADLIKRQIEG
jgi:tetratricopeptide (TPR) repeat protein